MTKDIVIFRKWKDGTIDAYFPFIPNDSTAVTCYSHMGQHSGANYLHCICQTKPATKEEYHDLFCELQSIGYNLEVRNRKPKHV